MRTGVNVPVSPSVMLNLFEHLLCFGRHAELGSASLETLKQVQGDSADWSECARVPKCHAELVSASDCISAVMLNLVQHL